MSPTVLASIALERKPDVSCSGGEHSSGVRMAGAHVSHGATHTLLLLPGEVPRRGPVQEEYPTSRHGHGHGSCQSDDSVAPSFSVEARTVDKIPDQPSPSILLLTAVLSLRIQLPSPLSAFYSLAPLCLLLPLLSAFYSPLLALFAPQSNLVSSGGLSAK